MFARITNAHYVCMAKLLSISVGNADAFTFPIIIFWPMNSQLATILQARPIDCNQFAVYSANINQFYRKIELHFNVFCSDFFSFTVTRWSLYAWPLQMYRPFLKITPVRGETECTGHVCKNQIDNKITDRTHFSASLFSFCIVTKPHSHIGFYSQTEIYNQTCADWFNINIILVDSMHFTENLWHYLKNVLIVCHCSLKSIVNILKPFVWSA